MRRLNCFIASAFGHQDVDTIYDNGICPVLNKLHLIPKRVDRIVHNEDIDDKIIALIRNCDLCIADLTYARPSVYYEAGFVYGLGKEVVYLARNDHFQTHKDDPNGSLRVHFDLQMKNIIPWTTPDEAFKRKLRDRLRLVIKPLILNTETLARVQMEKEEFKMLSQEFQFSTLEQYAISFLKSEEFVLKQASKSPSWSNHPFHKTFTKYRHGRHEQVQVAILHSLSPKAFNNLDNWLTTVSDNPERESTEFVNVLILATIRSVRHANLAKHLPQFHPITDNIFQMLTTTRPSGRRSMHALVCIDNICSFADFDEKLRSSWQTIENDLINSMPDL